MRGTINFTSKIGRGTQFHITLPMLETKDKTHKKRKKSRILVAEDNRINSLVVVKQLEKGGFIVDPVYNGQDAISMCNSNSYDLILMDIQMPIIDGLEATKKIRESQKSIPIIALTANGDREYCLSNGFNKFLLKPIPADKLIAIANEQIEKFESHNPT
jgi:CheY-like chemotaxis protein